MQEHTVRITTFSGWTCDNDFPFNSTTKLIEVIAWLQQRLEEIPPEYRQITECEIGSAGGYDTEHYATVEISYPRPETPVERDERLAREEREALKAKRREIAYARAQLADAKAILARHGEH